MDTTEELANWNDPRGINKADGIAKEGGESSVPVVPVMGFRSRTFAGKIVYLKFCVCDSMPCPQLLSDEELAQILSSPEPEQYRVPIHVGDRKSFTDKSGRNGDLYCVAFSKIFYEKRLSTSDLHRQFFVCLAVQEIENKHKIVIDRSRLRELRNVAELGEESMVITESRPLIEEIGSSTDVKINPTLGLRLRCPAYEIRRITDDSGEHLLALFRLNGVTDIEEIQLMATQRRLRLVVPRYYHVDVVLALRFDPTLTVAEFDPKDSTLKAKFGLIKR